MSARPGRALLADMRDAARETPDRIAERIARRAACEQAVREREVRFGTLTPENVREAIAFQEQRIAELVHAARLNAPGVRP